MISTDNDDQQQEPAPEQDELIEDTKKEIKKLINSSPSTSDIPSANQELIVNWRRKVIRVLADFLMRK